MSITEVICKNVIRLRKKQHISQLTLAYRSNVSVCCVERIEHASKRMQLAKVQKIANGLGVPLQQLFLPPEEKVNVEPKRCKIRVHNLEEVEKQLADKIGHKLRKELSDEIERIVQENTVEDK